MINYLFIPFIGSIPIISANLIQFIFKTLHNMEALIIILVIFFFGFLFLNSNLKDTTEHNF